MKKRYILLILVLLVAVIAEGIFCIRCIREHRHAEIDEWSQSLSTLSVGYAQAAKGYGTEKIAYNIPAYEYDALIEVLKTVTEDNCSRTEHLNELESEHRLGLQYNGRLWLFKCREEGWVSLTFADVETGAYYGCKGSLLYIDSPELWNYIVDTVDAKGLPVDSEAK